MMKRMLPLLLALVFLFGLSSAAMAEAAKEAILPDPLDFAHGLYYTELTDDYDYCICHYYEGDAASVQQVVDSYTCCPYNPLAKRWYLDATEVSKEEIQPQWGMGYASFALESEEQQTEGGLHVGSYLLTGVTDEGETVEILRLEALADGSVEYTLHGESWRYDYAAGTYERVE